MSHVDPDWETVDALIDKAREEGIAQGRALERAEIATWLDRTADIWPDVEEGQWARYFAARVKERRARDIEHGEHVKGTP